MKHNNDFKYDLKIGQIKEKELADILENKKIEVKYDLQATDTGNVFVEYESRGKPSGISTTESDYYCFAIGVCFVLIKTEYLKDICRTFLGSTKDIFGGDSNSSKGILLPISAFFSY